MPGERRFFGYDPATATLALLNDWHTRGYSKADPVYLGALETLHAYRQRIDELPTSNTALLRKSIDTELHDYPDRTPELQTPRKATSTLREGSFELLSDLAKDRRSVRAFTSSPINIDLIQKAMQVAQLSPSACNRQPWRVHHYNQRESIDAMLALQNGNRGFGHTIQTLLVLTSEASSFFDASERNEPYVDGGLFAMSLILALQAQGISSCCLNWCVEPKQDKAAHVQGHIPISERIIMYIAVGYADTSALVPRSPRRHVENIFVSHG
jgi:nitroreductase